MQRSRTARSFLLILAISLAILALGCAGLGLAVQQRLIELADYQLQLGPLALVTHAPRSRLCPEKADPLTNLCDRFSSLPTPPSYRILLLLSTPERGAQSSRVLLHLTIPLREEGEAR